MIVTLDSHYDVGLFQVKLLAINGYNLVNKKFSHHH